MSSRTLDLIGVYTAVLTWAAVGLAGLAGLGIDPSDGLWWATYAGYAVGLVPLAVGRLERAVPVLLTAQVLFGVVCFSLHPFGPTGVALVLSAVMLASYLTERLALALIAAQSLAVMALGSVLNPADITSIVTVTVVYLGFQVFAFMMVHATRREAAAREAAERARAALARAQTQLAARSRDEERLRIARDLHDTLGHQLTALALNLEVLAHTAAPPADEQAANCRDLAKEVLAEVRGVVGQLREPRTDLADRIAEIVPALPRPHLALSLDPELDLAPGQVDAVARLVQEALTNSARHSSSTTLRVQVSTDDGQVRVQASDDGAGRTQVVPGNGLRGMAERFEALGGSAGWSGDDGFTVHASLPVRVPATSR